VPATAAKTGTKPTIKILYAECDEKVLANHADAIQKAGHHVTTALSRQGVMETLRRDAFDLVILGSTMSKDDRHHLPYMVKKAHEGTKVLVMHAGTHHHEWMSLWIPESAWCCCSKRSQHCCSRWALASQVRFPRKKGLADGERSRQTTSRVSVFRGRREGGPRRLSGFSRLRQPEVVTVLLT